MDRHLTQGCAPVRGPTRAPVPWSVSAGWALLPAALLVSSPILRGQAVVGTVVDSATGVPARGTVLVLLDSTGARRGAALADSLGRFFLRAPGPGTYRVRSQQIGIASTVSLPMVLGAATPVRMTLRVSPLRVTLPAVVTETTGRCGTVAHTGDAGALWDEVIKALTATTVAPATGTAATPVTLRNFERELDPRTLRVRRAKTHDVTAMAQAPYASAPADTLAKYGFVVRQHDGTTYFAPDARTLVSDAFLRGHCLRARPADSAHPGLVGVAFEPVPGQRRADVSGTLWLDAQTAALRYLEYTYTRQSAAVPDSLAGGRVEFGPLASGAWIVRDWVIRMPRFALAWRSNGLATYATRATPDSVLDAVVETGGYLVAASETTSAPANATANASANSTANLPDPERPVASTRAVLYGSVLSDQNDTPVPEADVVVSPEHRARTDAAGQFRVAGIPPGKYTVVVRHLGHAAITLPLTLAAGDTLARDFVLAPGVPVLEPVIVNRNQGAPSMIGLGKMTGYAERRVQHLGRAVDSTTLRQESYRPLGEILRAHLAVQLLTAEGSGYVASPRGMIAGLDPTRQPAGDAADQRRGAKPACYAQIFVDGVRMYQPLEDAPLFDVNSIRAREIQAVEYFPGPAETPPEYGGTGASCGTLLLWTK